MNEAKELKTKHKKIEGYRKYINLSKQNIYYIDLIDFSSKYNSWIQEQLSKNQCNTFLSKNRGYKFVLVCIDGYTRYLMIRKLKTKSAKEVTQAMKSIIETYGAPKHICCDRGSEFINEDFRTNILKKYNIEMYHMFTNSKSVYAERVIRTIKELIMIPFNKSGGDWYSNIDNAVNKYNNSVHSRIKKKPIDLWKNNEKYDEITNPDTLSIKDINPQFDIGDYVRIKRIPNALQKRSLSYKWSEELYKVIDIDNKRMPIMYQLEGTNRKYYHWELLKSKCKPAVVSVIKTRNQSKKEPSALKLEAQHHRPVTRAQRQSSRK